MIKHKTCLIQKFEEFLYNKTIMYDTPYIFLKCDRRVHERVFTT